MATFRCISTAKGEQFLLLCLDSLHCSACSSFGLHLTRVSLRCFVLSSTAASASSSLCGVSSAARPAPASIGATTPSTFYCQCICSGFYPQGSRRERLLRVLRRAWLQAEEKEVGFLLLRWGHFCSSDGFAEMSAWVGDIHLYSSAMRVWIVIHNRHCFLRKSPTRVIIK